MQLCIKSHVTIITLCRGDSESNVEVRETSAGKPKQGFT